MLFGKLPEFFKNEEELRTLWSAPDTRAKLLHGLAEQGFGKDQLAEMQKIIDAEKSDIFDVLAHVAYALPALTREERAHKAKIIISMHFNSRQQVFLDFVLSHYVSVGVEELDQEKLTPLLRLKYHNSIADAVADLGKPDEIGKIFTGLEFSTKLRRVSAMGECKAGIGVGKEILQVDSFVYKARLAPGTASPPTKSTGSLGAKK